MHRVFIPIALFLLSATQAFAADFHMISRQVDGAFYGSHKVFTEKSEGLSQVQYCNRAYWVRPYTVAWVLWEAAEGRDVGLEYNNGKGWFRLCEDPESQVTLKDVGLVEDYVTIMRTRGKNLQHRQRFANIRQALKDYRNSGKYSKSYHAAE